MEYPAARRQIVHRCCRPPRSRRRSPLAVNATRLLLAHAVGVVLRARDQDAVRVVDPAQVRVTQGAGPGIVALQVDPVPLARLQFHREPVAVAVVVERARGLELTPRKVADRNPTGSGGVRCEVLPGGLGYRLDRMLLDGLQLRHVGNVDGHGCVGKKVAVTRPHGQLEPG